jgi:endoglucanase
MSILLLLPLLLLQAAPLGAAGPNPAPAMPGRNVPVVKVDTVGYPAHWRKIAVFNVEPKGAVVKDDSGKVAYRFTKGDVFAFGEDPASKDRVWQVDFTGLTVTGRYQVTGGGEKSDWFEVGPGVYRRALDLSVKHLYFQRCRTPLKEPYAIHSGASYTRNSACHDHAGVGWDLKDYPDKKRRIPMRKGWHDAGNFEMYVPSTAPTCQALLTAFERRPALFKDSDLDIPESGNGLPDILDEAEWGLEWVLCMQEKDGGVRHRDALMQWSPDGPADTDHNDRWVAEVGTASTAKACAAFAQAARVLKKRDPAFAARCEDAAQRAWKWLVAHPDRIVVDGHGSSQPLWDDGKEYPRETGARMVAAAEVYRTFGYGTALEQFRKLLATDDALPNALLTGAWTNLSRWALMGMIGNREVPEEVREAAKARLLETADLLRERVLERDGYRCASLPTDYYWGHNSNLMEKAEILAMAAQLDPEGHAWALEAARDQWHWVMGRNPNGYSMVTGVGRAPTAMFHCEWGRRPPPPGYLVGGPNSKDAGFLSPGAPAKALLWDNPEPLRSGAPAHAMWHQAQPDLWDGGFVPENQWTVGWWVVNEPDIYYNANLVLVASLMQE